MIETSDKLMNLESVNQVKTNHKPLPIERKKNKYWFSSAMLGFRRFIPTNNITGIIPQIRL